MADTDYPLLVFPEPVPADRARRHGGAGRIRRPAPAMQARRLAPQFERLQEALEERRLELQDNPLGILPEQALVIETIGSVQNFVRAIENIPGLEWLGEYEIEGIDPAHGFEDVAKPDKQLNGQLFLVMTDEQALRQLQRLFKQWADDHNLAFPRRLAPLKRAFENLHVIRPWDANDRMRETGVLQDWQERLKHEAGEVPFEIELWFRGDLRRDRAEAQLRAIIADHEGTVMTQHVNPEISYHAILGILPRTAVQTIIDMQHDLQDVRLLKCDDIMYVRPVGQCVVRVPADQQQERLTDEQLAGLDVPQDSTDVEPVVALFDGMPLTGHQLLANRVTVDDPDGYEASYQAHERRHGTHMASLICRGDLKGPSDVLERQLYVRPILQPRRGFTGHLNEAIPENVLPVDLIHRSVRRLFEPEGDEPPAAPTVRFVSLSVCDPARSFIREMSAWARLLDWLSWKYKILFIVSAGNHPQDIELAIPRDDFGSLAHEARELATIKALAADTRNRRLLAPAEALNGLTVGALHQDASQPQPGGYLINPFVRPGMPNVVSAHGPGYRRAIKPEVFYPGGRQLLREKLGTAHSEATLQITNFSSPPGQQVASPGTAGQPDQTCFTRGTSNAAALASRGAARLYRLLGELRQQPGVRLPAQYDVVLTKALLAHGATWDSSLSTYETALKNDNNSRTFKEYVARFLGYGAATLVRVLRCSEERVTVLGYGDLRDGEGAVFSLPLPPCLSSVRERRRLTITLAWLSPVNTLRRAYRVAHLWFDPKNRIAPHRLFTNHLAVQRGTLQHEVLEGDNATVFQDGDTIRIQVSCRSDAGEFFDQIPYGLAITLEITEGSQQRIAQFPIYEEIRDRLAVTVPIQGTDSV